jgi:hypothetical protein
MKRAGAMDVPMPASAVARVLLLLLKEKRTTGNIFCPSREKIRDGQKMYNFGHILPCSKLAGSNWVT